MTWLRRVNVPLNKETQFPRASSLTQEAAYGTRANEHNEPLALAYYMARLHSSNER